MVYECRYIHVWTVVKTVFLICGVIGLLFGLVYAIVLYLIGGLFDMVGGSDIEAISGLFSGSVGFFMIFFISFTYAVTGAVLAGLVSMLYNTFARLFGGIKVTLHDLPIQLSRSKEPGGTIAQVSHRSLKNNEEESIL